MTDDDWDKPQIGVASSWNEVTPCNLPLDRLAKRAKQGVRAAGGFPLEFVTIAVSDGISMGHEGMRASLVSREVIADSVETVMHAERFDGMVTLAGCDKSLPGHAHGRGPAQSAQRLPLRRVDPARAGARPGPRHHLGVRGGGGPRRGRPRPTRSCRLIEHNACPTEGSCAGMFTANTMASVAEALGMSLPGSSSAPAVDRRRDDAAYASGRAVVELLRAGIRPRQIMTKEAFENAIAVVMALGRLDQRRPPPAGHRQRGPGRAGPGRLQHGGRPGAPPGRHQAPREVPHVRPRPDRRGPGGAGPSCSRPGSSTGTA